MGMEKGFGGEKNCVVRIWKRRRKPQEDFEKRFFLQNLHYDDPCFGCGSIIAGRRRGIEVHGLLTFHA